MKSTHLPPGTHIGDYVVRATLGAGGMGTVYEVAHAETGGIYALKALSATSGATGVDRFLREGEAQARVDGHPNIVRVHSLSANRGLLCLIMDLAPGGDLSSRLSQNGPLPEAEAVEIARQLALGLAHAHACGVLHRDLKPANVLFDAQGIPQLVDFGLAFVSGAETLTQTGAVMGTPAFMAPEQATARERVGPAADVYGLGAVLYTMLCDRPPFEKGSVLATLNALVTQEPIPPSRFKPGLDPALEAICLRCMAKRPEDRYPSASALAETLAAYTRGGRGTPAKIGRGLAVVLLIFAAAVLLFTITHPGDQEATVEGVATNTPPLDTEQGLSPVAPPLEPPPSWYLEIPTEKRPHLPLPAEVEFGAEEREYVNVKDDSVLVWVSPGAFVLGSNASKNEKPVQRQRVPEGYFVGKYEVTWKQYRAFCEETRRELHEPLVPANRNHPVHAVTWYDAEAYCTWAGLRLPTGAEWEYAARGGDGRLIPWAKGFDLISLNRGGDATDDEFSSHCNLTGDADGYATTSPVNRFVNGASPSGCLGMAGNVSEWVADVWVASHSPDEVPRDGVYSARGGNWKKHRSGCRVTHRTPLGGSDRQSTLGFRVSRSHAPAPLEPPAWLRDSPDHGRPPLPLPPGIEFGSVPWEYRSRSDGSVLVWIPPGEFTMGSEHSYRSQERPSQRRQVRAGFFMGKYEVSWAQFLDFLEKTGKPKPEQDRPPGTHPVTNISWRDATEYCGWAGLRLPNETEWEYAARGQKDDRDFTWTNAIRSGPMGTTPSEVDPEFELYCNTGGEADRFPGTNPVDAFPLGASPFGCLGMNGNVSEFTSGPWTDTLAPDAIPRHGRHAYRGGHFDIPAARARITRRKPTVPVQRAPFVGFRVARSP